MSFVRKLAKYSAIIAVITVVISVRSGVSNDYGKPLKGVPLLKDMHFYSPVESDGIRYLSDVTATLKRE